MNENESQPIFVQVGVKADFVTKKQLIQDERPYRIRQLKEFLSKDQHYIETFPPAHPIEIVFDGNLLEESDLIPESTTKEKRIQFLPRFIKEPSKEPNEDYFKMRNWEFRSMMQRTAEFDTILENLQDKGFQHVHKELINQIRMWTGRNENSKSPVITQTIIAAFKKEGFKLQNDYQLEVGDIHKVKPDHVLFDEQNFPVLITEDEALDLHLGVIQNLDQLLAFSMTSVGKECALVCGLVSNEKQFIFTCFIRPVKDKSVQQENFKISKAYDLILFNSTIVKESKNDKGEKILVQVSVVEPEERSATMLIRAMRGFVLRGYKDKFLDQTFVHKKSFKELVKTVPTKQSVENEIPLLFHLNDFSELEGEGRNYILRNFQQGEVLLDVFGGSGALAVRALKLGLEVYVNGVSSDYCKVVYQNFDNNQIQEKFHVYGVEPGKFIKNIIPKTKVNHICMLHPTDSLEYLDHLRQAFLQRSEIAYPPGGLPMIYIYATCPENEELEFQKNLFFRKAQDYLIKDMMGSLQGEIFHVYFLNNVQVYGLQFRLPDEILTFEPDIEPMEKKIHL